MEWILNLVDVLVAPAAGAFGAWWGGTIAVRTTQARAEADRIVERERYERERREEMAVLVVLIGHVDRRLRRRVGARRGGRGRLLAAQGWGP